MCGVTEHDIAVLGYAIGVGVIWQIGIFLEPTCATEARLNRWAWNEFGILDHATTCTSSPITSLNS